MKTDKTDIETLSKADWTGLEKDVVLRIRLLRGMCRKIERGALSDRIANDLILPNLRLLAAFCTNIEIGDEQ